MPAATTAAARPRAAPDSGGERPLCPLPVRRAAPPQHTKTTRRPPTLLHLLVWRPTCRHLPPLASTLASTASPAGGTSGHRCADPGSGRARDGAAIKLGAHGGTTTDSPPATAHQEGDWCCARFEESGLRSAHRHRRGHSAESGGRGGRRGRRARRRETGGQQTCHTPRTDTRTDTL